MTSFCRTGMLILLIGLATLVFGQPAFPDLTISTTPPANLLSSRSVALFDYTLTSAELVEFQRGFQRIGIDAIAYFTKDVVTAGKDPLKAYSQYFEERQISFLLLIEKGSYGYRFTATAFNHKPSLADAGQPAWQVSQPKVNELLTNILQDAWRSQKKSNYLINDFPETDITVDIVKGRRQEFYAIDLKVDNLAVPKFGNETMDAALEQFFSANYPLKYKLVDAGSDEQALRRQGFLYVLCFVHTRGEAAKEVLGYDMSKGEKSYASIAYPEGQLQLKILAKDEVIYKFYFRHIDNGNVFLGTKWDADSNWLDALRNHVLAFKQEAKIN
jgi:hypothetical protein